MLNNISNIIIAGILIFAAYIFLANLDVAMSDAESYSISANEATYWTKYYSEDSITHCITFKDALGIKRTVCGAYTITKFNN